MEKTTPLLKEGQTRLSDAQVRRYAGVDRYEIARVLECSTKTVRDVLGGRERCTGDKAYKVVELAEKMVGPKGR